MNTTKTELLERLESELSTSTPPVTTQRARSTSGTRRLTLSVAAVVAFAGSLLATGVPQASAAAVPQATEPAQAQAAGDCQAALRPNAVGRDHTKYCSLGTYAYDFKRSETYYHARTKCFWFHATAFMCGFTSRYDRGTMKRCKTY
jgi:hypothetical protein